MMTREQAQAIYRAGEETVVRVLGEWSREMDQLKADFAVLKAENLALRGECRTLREKVQALEEQVAKDSHNSSKPPSSDGLAKPKPKSLRPPSDRPTGGQPGHPGHTLRRVDQPDHTVRHAVERGKDCGRSLAKQTPDRVERRQVFELPEPKLEITEHQGEVKTCACGCVNRAAFPAEAAAPVQYGPRVKSVAVYLKEYQLLPFDRLTEIMRDLFACESFSQGTLANFDADCSRRLEPVEAAIRDLTTQSEVAGFDETGVRAVGSLHWLHTVSTQFLTWYYAHKRRGRQAMDAAGILPGYRGCAVHDFWESYLDYHCDHAFCNGHLLRELIFLWEEQNQKWAKSMIDHLLGIKDAVAAARTAGLAALPEADLDRFHNHPEGILAFMRNFSVPFDNNLSERDLRMMKLRQKISGTFRNFDALVDFCRIRGYVSTARKNGLNALAALRRVFSGDPFVPAANTS
jgi:transposase